MAALPPWAAFVNNAFGGGAEPAPAKGQLRCGACGKKAQAPWCVACEDAFHFHMANGSLEAAWRFAPTREQKELLRDMAAEQKKKGLAF